MSIYDQVEKLLEQDKSPHWANEILVELQEVKKLLLQLNTANHVQTDTRDKSHFLSFVNKLRKEMKADVENSYFPQINYKNRELGINFNGYLYDKLTTKVISRDEAYTIYRFLYENRQNLDKYLIK